MYLPVQFAAKYKTCSLTWAMNFNIVSWNDQRHKPRNNNKQTSSDFVQLYTEVWKEYKGVNRVQALIYMVTNSVCNTGRWDHWIQRSSSTVFSTAFATLLQILEICVCDMGQNLLLLFQCIGFKPSQFVKVASNLLCHFFPVGATGRIRCWLTVPASLGLTSIPWPESWHTTAITRISSYNNLGTTSCPYSKIRAGNSAASPDSGKTAFSWVSLHARNKLKSQDFTSTHTHRLLC